MIDLHAHVVLDGVTGRAGAELGPEMCDDPPRFRVGGYVLEGVRYRGTPFTDIGMRLERMDQLGVDYQVLSPNPITYFEHVAVEDAERFARWHNDELAATIAPHRDRLGGFAQVPLQDPERAAAELERAVLDLGLLGAYVGTDYGIDLDDPAMDGFYQTCVDLDVPLMIHPAPPGIDGPLRDARLRRFDLDLWLAFSYEETLTLATLVLGGVTVRHPDLRICLSHGGGALVAVIGKLRRAATSRPWADDDLRQPGEVETRLRSIYYDAHVSDPTVLGVLEQLVGTDRVVGGTNFAGWDQPSAVSDLRRFDANAVRLLGPRYSSTGLPSES